MAVDLTAALGACSSRSFAEQLVAEGPYASLIHLIDGARNIWWNKVNIQEWFAAFAAHPRLGDLETLRAKSGTFADLSRGEQSAAAASASEDLLRELADWNRRYESKFGHVFLLCASGKTVAEMLAAVKARFDNPPSTELMNAAKEQMKITELRLQKLVEKVPEQATAQVERRAGQVLRHLDSAAVPAGKPPSCHITTHVLDTSRGRPAAGVAVVLHRRAPGSADAGDVWDEVARGATNPDGRIGNWLAPSATVDAGVYRITFDTSAYMATCHERHPDFFPAIPFYPKVSVFFQITEAQTREHFHVPLTWNPYGYSTYRGS